MTERRIQYAAGWSGWRKSSYSNSEGGSCVEVLDGHPAGVPVRDSKNPHGPALFLPATAWSVFVSAVREDAF
ncbi:DUF397 domain-containing protein [Streptomyces sp. NPDC006879]|uniref:DUF397 domain-containing protein n=1 Tax=Streptomyces sp. NPDC006879 TaxID=3364767 RepID=UPI0036800DDC